MFFVIIIYSTAVVGTRASMAFLRSFFLFASFSCSANQTFKADLLVEDHHRDLL